ncbi:hypothetical protein [Methylobacterium sp. ARG-1]|uniref:hypothetical protein n=1 Tax=Methylobacterium sp. ARG-1 TaxID=1692501 RepID=UPI00068069E5|nr:hypothetical protein [Methylobacterium sp. ARG-1]KNY19424.1 hypothetical protein AKJ13_28000 [Methylobacterium sp. ARG-1]
MGQGSDKPAAESRDRLRNISDALGVPVAAFYSAGDETESYLLKLVAAYLDAAKPEVRARFIGAIEALLQAERSGVDR